MEHFLKPFSVQGSTTACCVLASFLNALFHRALFQTVDSFCFFFQDIPAMNPPPPTFELLPWLLLFSLFFLAGAILGNPLPGCGLKGPTLSLFPFFPL